MSLYTLIIANYANSIYMQVFSRVLFFFVALALCVIILVSLGVFLSMS